MTEPNNPTRAALRDVLISHSALREGLVEAEKKIGEDKRHYDVGAAAYYAVEGALDPLPDGRFKRVPDDIDFPWIGAVICSMHEHLNGSPRQMREALLGALPQSAHDLAPSEEVLEKAAEQARLLISRIGR